MSCNLAPTVTLDSGYEMPIIGLGTYMSKGCEVQTAVKHAIDVGYRHIDTAYLYENERDIGWALCGKVAEGCIQREDVFVTTKLWNIYHEPNRVESACRRQLALLNIKYIDLYLLHFPVGYKYVNDTTLKPVDAAGNLQLNNVDYVETYKAMEELVKMGLVRSLGVSNFNTEQLKRLLQNCNIRPVTNQVEITPALPQRCLIQFCKKNCMTVTAYRPLGKPNPKEKTPDYLYSEKTQALANKHQKTPVQVVLRYLHQLGTIPIPKSKTPRYITENFGIFDFQLSAEDMCVMDSFNTGARFVTYADVKKQNHQYYPFDIE